MHKNSIGFTILIAGLGVLPPLSIDMGLPALAPIAQSLHTSDALAAMTLSLFLVGFAVAPLFCGPLSDRFGRRPILIAGCLTFAISAAGCAFAPSIQLLLACRLLQGLGSGAATVLSTALVRDLFEGHEARARLSQIGVLRSFAPMIAPTIGAWILSFAQWRFIYGLLAVVGAVQLSIVYFGFVESAKLNKSPLTLKALASDYLRVVKHRISFGYAVMNALYFGAIFTYVTNSPLLMMKHFGLSRQAFGIMFAGTAFGIMAGSWVNGQMSKRKVLPKVPLYIGMGLASAAVATNLALTALHLDSPMTLFPCLFAFTFSAGLLAPNVTHGCVEHMPDIAGVASAVMAFSQMMSGALAGMIVSAAYDESTSWAMTIIMMSYVFASALVFFTVVRPGERKLARA